MRSTTKRQITALGRLLVCCAFAGCQGKPSGGGGNTSGAASSSLAALRQTQRQTVEIYLKELGEGQVTPARLTPGFRTLIAPPITADDQKLGYSESTARQFLTRFEKATWVVGDVVSVGPAIVARGRAELSGSKSAFSLRLQQRGDELLADWLQLSERVGATTTYPDNVFLAQAQDAARNYLDLLLGGDMRQAQALMNGEWRKKISPLGIGAKPQAGFDYDPGFLTQTLRAWIGRAVTYTIADAKLLDSRDNVRLAVEFEVEGNKVPHTMKLKYDNNTGQWLIDGFDS